MDVLSRTYVLGVRVLLFFSLMHRVEQIIVNYFYQDFVVDFEYSAKVAKIHIYTGRLKHQISRAGMTHFRHYGFRCHIVGEIVRFYGLASIKKNLLIQLSDSLTTMERHTFNKPKRGRQLPRLWIVSTLMRLTNR